MKYIKGINRHGSETFLLLLKNSQSLEIENIIKSSTTERGINSIISESEGIKWYNERNKNKIIFKLEKKTNTYYKIKIDINKGFYNINSNVSYINLKRYLDLTINHYIQTWQEFKNKSYAPFHGDLSLVGNVMFNDENEVLFVDWEQFDNSLKMPTGLDLMMTLIENFWYETKRLDKIHKDVLQHLVYSVKKLNEAQLLSPLLKDKPAQSSIHYINSNIAIWNGQHQKLPAIKVPKRYIKLIDDAYFELI